MRSKSLTRQNISSAATAAKYIGRIYELEEDLEGLIMNGMTTESMMVKEVLDMIATYKLISGLSI
jgi:hypothetical protein